MQTVEVEVLVSPEHEPEKVEVQGAVQPFIPSGGQKGQVLTKQSDASFDVEWKSIKTNEGGDVVVEGLTEEDVKRIVQETAVTQESDPTVPAWAKQPNKPTYTASEVGALSQGELQNGIDEALRQAKESGEFDGEDGKDYVLTEADKQEIADMVEVPSDGSVDLQPLTFTGAVEATYDGKTAVTVNIPSGGGGSGGEWKLLKTIELEQDVQAIRIEHDNTKEVMYIFRVGVSDADGTASGGTVNATVYVNGQMTIQNRGLFRKTPYNTLASMYGEQRGSMIDLEASLFANSSLGTTADAANRGAIFTDGFSALSISLIDTTLYFKASGSVEVWVK